MSEPEYTLKQAISIYELSNSRLWEHQEACDDCILIADGWNGLCDEGREIERVKRKWKRRIKQAAVREGVQMTV